MSLATMFQDKSREVALSTALLIGAAGIYNNNAQVDTQAVNHSAPHTQQAEPDDYFGDAADYAKEHNTIAIWICAPAKIQMPDGRTVTPQEIARQIEKIFQKGGVENVKAFSTVSLSGGDRVAVYVGNELYRDPATGKADFNLGTIQPQLQQIMTDYTSGTGVEAPSLTFQPRNNR